MVQGLYQLQATTGQWLVYPVLGYTGYGDGIGTDLTAFITHEMCADWEANRAELMAFRRSGKTEVDVFPVALPWLYVGGRPSRIKTTGTDFPAGISAVTRGTSRGSLISIPLSLTITSPDTMPARLAGLFSAT
jgi:hypothetical protein